MMEHMYYCICYGHYYCIFLCCGFQEHADNEAVTNDVGGQALVENIAHKLFVWADGEDRAARFNK